MYVVITKEPYTDQWTMMEYGNPNMVKEAVLAAQSQGQEWEVLQPCEVEIQVKITDKLPEFPDNKPAAVRRGKNTDKKDGADEAEKSGSEEDPGPGDPGNGPV